MSAITRSSLPRMSRSSVMRSIRSACSALILSDSSAVSCRRRISTIACAWISDRPNFSCRPSRAASGSRERADQRDDLVEVVERDEQALQDVGARLGLAQLELRAADDDLALVIHVVVDQLAQVQRLRHAVDQRDHVHAERGLQRRVLVDLVEDDLRDRVALELDDQAHAVAVGLVAQVGDLREAAVVVRLLELHDQAGAVAAAVALVDLVRPHRHEPRVDPRRGRADARQAELLRGRQRLGVEVVDDLHVVGDEADRHDHHAGGVLPRQIMQVVVDVGLEPRHVRRAGPRAEHQLAAVPGAGLLPHPLDDLGGDAAVLGDVGAAARPARLVHRARDRVRHEHQVRLASYLVGQLGQPGQGGVDHRLDEARMVEVVPQPVEPRGARHARRRRRPGSPGTAGSRSTTSRPT